METTHRLILEFDFSLQLMLSGILGSIIMLFKPIQQKKLRQFFIKLLRISSTIVTFIAAICTLIAAYFALTFLITFLSPSTNCAPYELLVTSSPCKCTYSQSIWGTELLPQVYRFALIVSSFFFVSSPVCSHGWFFMLHFLVVVVVVDFL